MIIKLLQKSLLNKEILNQFNEALKERKDRGHSAEITFIGVNSAEIKDTTKLEYFECYR